MTQADNQLSKGLPGFATVFSVTRAHALRPV
jgi:hypothetical protein